MLDKKTDQQDKDSAELDVHTTQKDISGASHDPIYVNFLTRVDQAGSGQVLRYCRWKAKPSSSVIDADQNQKNSDTLVDDGMLLFSSKSKTLRQRVESGIPPTCEQCGSKRYLEFQVKHCRFISISLAIYYIK